ncbi:hypothetical protein ACFWUQ_29990 [Streptomyces sp. NPDC058662]
MFDQPAEARHGIPLAGGRAGPWDTGDLRHHLLGLGLPTRKKKHGAALRV